MGNLKILTAILGFLTLLLLLVLMRSFNPEVFQGDANDAILEVKDATVSPDQLAGLGKTCHIIDLDGKTERFKDALPLRFEDLLLEENTRILKTLEGEILLYSEQPATAVKAWVILNQLKFTRLKILSDEQFPEELKYEFQPDTTVRLEFDKP